MTDQPLCAFVQSLLVVDTPEHFLSEEAGGFRRQVPKIGDAISSRAGSCRTDQTVEI